MNSLKNNGLVMLVMATNSVNLQHLSAIRTTVLLRSYGRMSRRSGSHSQVCTCMHIFLLSSVCVNVVSHLTITVSCHNSWKQQ